MPLLMFVSVLSVLSSGFLPIPSVATAADLCCASGMEGTEFAGPYEIHVSPNLRRRNSPCWVGAILCRLGASHCTSGADRNAIPECPHLRRQERHAECQPERLGPRKHDRED